MAASTPGRREAPAAPESIVARTLAALHRRDHAWLGPEGTPLGSAEEVLEDLALVLTAAMDLNDTTLFARYLAWIADVMEVRGQPRSTVLEALETWGREARHDQEAEPERVHRFMAHAMRALASPPGEGAFSPPPVPSRPQASLLLTALLDRAPGDVHAILTQALDDLDDLAEVADTIIMPAMYELGELWASGSVSVVQEHVATALLERALAGLHQPGPAPSVQERAVLVACVPGNRHGLGARILSDVLEREGAPVLYIGADPPADALLEAVASSEPRALALSISLPQQLPATLRLLEALADLQDRGMVFERFLGGPLLNTHPGIGSVLPVEGWAETAREARQVVLGA